MSDVVKNGQFAKVLIQSYQHSACAAGFVEQCLIARILTPLTSPDDIVARCAEGCYGSAPNAGVEEQFHAGTELGINSTRSWPTNLLA